tara:strand:+ start:4346 stop:6391 length:2046 start_codon:yes stop_codon:yes gene_type:complete
MRKLTCILALAVTAAAHPSLAQDATPPDAPRTTTLDRVVVTAGEEKIAIETPQSVTVIDQEDLESAQPTTIGDVLTDIPGVKAVGSDRVMGESFNIRGIGTLGSSDEYRIIVQVDGATKFHEQYRMGSFFSDPELYKKVEVLRGPASSTLYGSGALAGVISLTTKDASDFLRPNETVTFREKLEFNDNRGGFLTSSILAAEPVKNLELLGSFNYRRSDNFRHGGGDIISGSAFAAPSGLVKAKYSFGMDKAHAARLSYQHWTTEASGSDLSQTGTQSGFGDIDREVVDQTVVAGYTYTPPSNPLVDLDLLFSYTNTNVEQTNASNQGAFGNSAIFEPVTYAYENYQARAENTMEVSGETYVNYLTTGIEYAKQVRTADKAARAGSPGNGVTFHPGGESERVGVYIQNEWIYNDRLTLIPGFRADWQTLTPGDAVTVTQEEVSDVGVSPKLATFFKIDRNWGVFGSVAYTERLPVIDEAYDNSSSNVNLEPEISVNYEAGVSVSFKDIALKQDAVSAKVTLFHNDIDNLIERQTQTSTYRNVGEATIEGVEFETSYNSKFVFARAAFTMIRGMDTESGEDLNSIPADELAMTIGGRAPSANLEFGLRSVFARAQDRVSGTGEPTGSYGIHNLYATWKPDDGYLKDAEFRFGIDNLFDRFYKEHLAGDPAKGRTFKVSVAKQF